MILWEALAIYNKNIWHVQVAAHVKCEMCSEGLTYDKGCVKIYSNGDWGIKHSSISDSIPYKITDLI